MTISLEMVWQGERLRVELPRMRDPFIKKSAWLRSVIAADDGNVYIPGKGWYDPRASWLTGEGPRPEREMNWLEKYGIHAWGQSRATT